MSRTLYGGGSYPSSEVKSVFSTAPADWAIRRLGFMAHQPLMGYFMPNPVYVLLYHGKEPTHSETELIIYQLKWYSSTSIISLSL